MKNADEMQIFFYRVENNTNFNISVAVKRQRDNNEQKMGFCVKCEKY